MSQLDGKTLRAALHAQLDAGTVAKGRAYQMQRRVLSCIVAGATGSEWSITADVRGSRATPYQVDITITKADADWEIGGFCSCPMEMDCKHVAATLLHVLERPEQWFAPIYQVDLPGGQFAPARASAVAPQLDYRWESWLRSLDQIAAAPASDEADQPASTQDVPERIVYILKLQQPRLAVELAVARQLKAGGWGQPQSYQFSNVLYGQPPARFVRPLDVELVRKLMLAQGTFNTYELFLDGAKGGELLQELIATERCHWRGGGKHRPVLTLGTPRPATPVWVADAHGRQSPAFKASPAATHILPLSPPWYVDETAATCGPLEIPVSAAVAQAWLSSPVIEPREAWLVATELAPRFAGLGLPLPVKVEIEEAADIKPVPCLRLYSTRLKRSYYSYYSYSSGTKSPLEQEVNFAHLDFDYAGFRVAPDQPGDRLENFADGRLRRVQRDLRAERKAWKQLSDAGFTSADAVLFNLSLGKFGRELVFAEADEWFPFMQNVLPKLQSAGWRIELDDSFRFRLAEPEDWYGDAESDGGNDWFGVELGVKLDGQKVNLLPILVRLLQDQPNTFENATLAQLPDNAVIPVPLPDGRTLPFPANRARQMLGVLLELLNPDALNQRGQLRLNKLRAAELADETDWRWLGSAELSNLSRRLRSFDGIKAVAPSSNLRATLRPYQQDGLNWLQFLREYELAGILADDMGLGKTVQALAHLLTEKESGRADRPSLVIAPTSLMTNWRQETERFAPGLRVLVLHGLERKQNFDQIAAHDLVITSYPLLPRDKDVLLEHEFHYLILDEAQFIKNAKTTYAQAACQLKARHHLCLTGTPMENHLGELWSLFRFLLPGFLGDEIRFNSIFRRPIERGNNDERRKLLANRVAPFILRRRKEEVVKELPPKTEITQNVELSGAQRDLYESVRLAMHERVKAEVDRKGLSRAHIIILDALLKLRQICCHPQLLKLPSAQKVQESAKLELLLDLLPEMIEEGRRVLLFSQFTSMLALIETAVTKLKIPYAQLTGQTRDRATPVAQFQNDEVPLFLISLKAGGTGLNLTAADTVIHYDPWWNPAVENQATDRAHRIGQDKKVFVYKLMTVGTVEEKIAAMQVRKRELVEGLLNEERPDNLKLTANDLDVLFSPLQ